MIGTQQIRFLNHEQLLRNFNKLLDLFSLTDWILRSELPHLVLIPLHAKLLFLPVTLLLFRIHKDSLLGCAYSTAG